MTLGILFSAYLDENVSLVEALDVIYDRLMTSCQRVTPHLIPACLLAGFHKAPHLLKIDLRRRRCFCIMLEREN